MKQCTAHASLGAAAPQRKAAYWVLGIGASVRAQHCRRAALSAFGCRVTMASAEVTVRTAGNIARPANIVPVIAAGRARA